MEHFAPHIELDDLHTPVGFFGQDGRLRACNLAMSVWCSGQTDTLAEVLGVADDDAIVRGLAAGEQLFRRLACNTHGRHFPAEFLARRFSMSRELEGVLVEGRDASRTEERAAMLKSFSRVIDSSNRKLRMQTAELTCLLDSMPQALFAVDAQLTISSPVSRRAAALFGRQLEGEMVLDTLYGQLARDGEVFRQICAVFAAAFGADAEQWQALAQRLPARLSYHRPDENETRLFDIDHAALWSATGTVERIVFSVTDATSRIQDSKEAQALQRLRSLKGLLGRRDRAPAELLAEARRQLAVE